MNKVYVANHKPRFNYLEGIQTFKLRDDLPEELYNLDILDGSPPCSSFSMAGNREKDWGKEKKFKEGQAEQVLDTLFFDFIDLAQKLKPKVVIAENVKGLLMGEAQRYVNKILQAFDKAGYYVTYTLLDASKMGVPQKRERVFFTAIRKDLYKGSFVDLFQSEPALKLDFNEKEIFFSEYCQEDNEITLEGAGLDLWGKVKAGHKFSDAHPKGHYFAAYKIKMDEVCKTIIGKFRPKSAAGVFHPTIPRALNKTEYSCAGSYPQDYDFMDQCYGYMIGMSVPPLMTARIANEIKKQWLDKIAPSKNRSERCKAN